MQLYKINRERFDAVYQDISEGSEPALRFYLLVTVSTLIACFGLIADSTAVVIGAMLVAPLMTPIFGISLALVRGDTHLLGRALRAEIVGVAVAVTMSLVLGLLLGDFEPTDEILSRTRPTLFDLLVAVLAGLAGAYALVDEKISPALPGVAIATAIVPPLANTGLCLALGDMAAAMGSFLLFLANFFSILVVASITFVLCGMARRFGVRAKGGEILRRFRMPLVAFVVIIGFLGHSLFKIAQERRMAKDIRATLVEETSRIPATILNRMEFYFEEEEKRIHVVASVSTPAALTPTQVSRIQDQLAEELGRPTELIVHCVLSSNVSALGSVKNTIIQNVDGSFEKSVGNDTLNNIATAEQVIREHFAADIALDLSRVEFVPYGKYKAMLAHVIGFRDLTVEEIRRMEAEIRNATGDSGIVLIISRLDKTMVSANGPFRYGWILGRLGSDEIRERIRPIREELSATFRRDEDFELVSTNVNYLDERFHFLLEIAGPDVYPQSRVDALREQLEQEFAEPMDLYAWSRVETVHGPAGPLSMRELDEYFSSRQKENLPDDIQILPGASGR